jgi:hypothetical protein
VFLQLNAWPAAKSLFLQRPSRPLMHLSFRKNFPCSLSSHICIISYLFCVSIPNTYALLIPSFSTAHFRALFSLSFISQKCVPELISVANSFWELEGVYTHHDGRLEDTFCRNKSALCIQMLLLGLNIWATAWAAGRGRNFSVRHRDWVSSGVLS